MFELSEADKLAMRVQDAIKERPEVRPFPAAVTQLMTACDDPDATAATFEKIIECDPALAVRLLRMANSPLCGLSKEVRTISHATSVLGIRHMRSLAVATAGASMFAQGSTGAAVRQALWNHSLGVATIARMLAKFIPVVSAEDAFLAGIFHDVGKLLLYDVIEDEYVELSKSYSGVDLALQERELLQTTHEEIGWKSAHGWGLSPPIYMAIGYHHRPADVQVHAELVSLIHIADHLAKAWDIGSENRLLCNTCDGTMENLHLNEELLQKIHAEASTAYQEVVQAMSA